MNLEAGQQPSGGNRRGLHVVARWTGLTLFVAVGSLYLGSPLVAPPLGVGVLWVIWLVLLVAVIRVWRSHPWWVFAAPFLAYLIWAGILLAGDFFLGWTA